MMAFLIFGYSVPQFAGFGASVATCFGMMLGDFGDVAAQLGQLTGAQVCVEGVWGGLLVCVGGGVACGC